MPLIDRNNKHGEATPRWPAILFAAALLASPLVHCVDAVAGSHGADAVVGAQLDPRTLHVGEPLPAEVALPVEALVANDRAKLPAAAVGPLRGLEGTLGVQAASVAQTLLDEGFEGVWPAGPWGRGWFSGYAPNLAFGKSSLNPFSGSGSVWAVGAAAAGTSPPPPGGQAPLNTGTYMRVGPFDLSDVTSGLLTFKVLGNMGPTEELRLYFSESSSSVSGPYLYGRYSNGSYNHIAIDIATWADQVDLRGRTAVWFWFAYFSGSGSPRNGAYLDVVRLDVYTNSGACAGPDQYSPIPQGVREFNEWEYLNFPCGSESPVRAENIELLWSDTGAINYEWQVFSEGCEGEPVMSGETQDTSVELLGPLDPGRYCYRVRAHYIGIESGFASCWSSCCCFTVEGSCSGGNLVPVPDGVYDPGQWDLFFPCGSSSEVGSQNLQLSWSSTGAASYDWQLFSGSCDGTPVASGESSSTSVTIPGQLPPGRYCFRVRGWYIGTFSSFASCWSSCCCFTVRASCVLGIPTVTVTGANGPVACGSSAPIGTTVPMFSWNTVAGATGYEVELYAGSCGGTRLAAQAVTSTAVTIGLLNPGTYCFRVRATKLAGTGCQDGCGDCYGAWTSCCCFVVAEPCTLTTPAWQETGGRGCAGSGEIVLDAAEAVTLEWGAVAQATEYEIEVATACGGVPIYTAVVASTSLTLPQSLSLDSEKTYTWRCRPRRPTPAGCTGPWTPCCSFRRRAACLQLPAPQPASTSGRACGSIVVTATERPTLEWTAVNGATGYEWQIARECGGVPIDVGVTAGQSATSVAISRHLAPGTYRWRVRSRGDGRTSCTGPWSGCCGCSVPQYPAACRVRLGYDYFAVGLQNTGGINNSRWAGDLELTNYGNAPTTVEIALLPQGRNGLEAAAVETVELPAGSVTRLENVVARLDASGKVANTTVGIRVLGDATGVGAVARSYNTKPGGGVGTFGTWLPVVAAAQGQPYGKPAVLHGLKQSANLSVGYRTHLGLQNLTLLTTRVRVNLYESGNTSLGEKVVDLRPFEYRLLLNILGSGPIAGGFATIDVETPGGLVFPWANVVENASGDPMIVTGSAVRATEAKYCMQAIAWARNPCTGQCEMFPTLCAVPEGYELCDPAMECDWPWTYRLRDPVCGECREFFGCPFQLPPWPSCD